MSLLTVEHLTTTFQTRAGVVRAVSDVCFTLQPGETLGIVGESGSGKSVTCYSLLGLIPTPPGRIESGRALFANTDLLQCSPAELNRIRGKSISLIFQDPMTSLNPYLRISEQIMEPLIIHEKLSRATAFKRAVTALEEVGIPDASRRILFYPHQFSGGMRQRVMIAMALITQPEILIADEPTTALDVTVQAQILELIRELQQRRGMAVILVTHDLGIVSNFCDRVLVMYAGSVLETGTVRNIFEHPQHPYNEALQRSIPSLQPRSQNLFTIPGTPPSLTALPPGCPFTPRCQYALEICHTPIALRETAPNHFSACTRIQMGELQLP